MLFYSAILIVVAFTAAVLGFVLLGGTAAFVLRMCFVGAFLLFVISLARRKKKPIMNSSSSSGITAERRGFVAIKGLEGTERAASGQSVQGR